MAMRLKIIDLSAYPQTAPFKVAIQCAYWSLRMRNVSLGLGQTMNGTPLEFLSGNITDPADGTASVSIDFPPVFDGAGRPVLWNQLLDFNGRGNVVNGVVILAIYDPATPESPAR